MRKYLIEEVKVTRYFGDGTLGCEPVNCSPNEGCRVNKDRIIDKNRLKYGIPKKGDISFYFGDHPCWHPANDDHSDDSARVLILNPPEQGEFEKWCDNFPTSHFKDYEQRAFIDWLKKMPRGK